MMNQVVRRRKWKLFTLSRKALEDDTVAKGPSGDAANWTTASEVTIAAVVAILKAVVQVLHAEAMRNFNRLLIRVVASSGLSSM
jgi:hypothetical protein